MRVLLVGFLVALCSCTGGSGSGSGGGAGGGSGGAGGAGGTKGFTSYDLDTAGTGLTFLAIASDPVAERVGVAYFVDLGKTDGGNTDNYAVRYVEWKKGVTSTPQTMRDVQRTAGISVAFQPSGEPAVAYLGGGADLSAYWYQSDAVVNYRTGGTTWTEQSVLTTSSQAPVCPTLGFEMGFLVGLWPSLVFDGTTAIFAYRDAHSGAFKKQDWGPSDVKVSSGGPTAWTTACAAQGTDTSGYGGRIDLILAAGQPALLFDAIPEDAVAQGNTIYFQKRKSDLSWTGPATVLTIANTQSGGSLAYDATEGYGIAAIERSTNTLLYTHSTDGVTWSTATPIFASGTGGWYPSLAMDPALHEPAVAFYLCSASPNIAEGSCPASQDELRIIQRNGANWTETLVDKEGAFLPKLGFFASGKRFVVYLVPTTGKLRLSVEK